MTPDLSSLQSDGDTIDLDDVTLRLRIEPDQYTAINDYDSYGKVAETRTHPDYGHRPRPGDFDGNAEIIGRRRDYWWQPPSDGPKRGTPEFDKLRHLINDLLEYGFSCVMLELLRGTDAYGRAIVIDVESLCGIDSYADGYLEDLLGDLWLELQHRQGQPMG